MSKNCHSENWCVLETSGLVSLRGKAGQKKACRSPEENTKARECQCTDGRSSGTFQFEESSSYSHHPGCWGLWVQRASALHQWSKYCDFNTVTLCVITQVSPSPYSCAVKASGFPMQVWIGLCCWAKFIFRA